jgi:hypothetical protein
VCVMVPGTYYEASFVPKVFHPTVLITNVTASAVGWRQGLLGSGFPVRNDYAHDPLIHFGQEDFYLLGGYPAGGQAREKTR